MEKFMFSFELFRYRCIMIYIKGLVPFFISYKGSISEMENDSL